MMNLYDEYKENNLLPCNPSDGVPCDVRIGEDAGYGRVSKELDNCRKWNHVSLAFLNIYSLAFEGLRGVFGFDIKMLFHTNIPK